MLVLWRADGYNAEGGSLRSTQHAGKYRDGLGSAHCSSRECHGRALAAAGCIAALGFRVMPLHEPVSVLWVGVELL